MGPRIIVPLDPSSPWSGFARPDLKHCEDNLSGWIAAPANTWSNLAFIVVGLWMWRRHRDSELGRWFAAVTVIVGLTSLLFHASYAFLFQFFDYLGMFLYMLLLLFLNARRLGWVGAGWGKSYLAGVAGSCVLLLLFRRLGLPIQSLIVIQVALFLPSEAWLAMRAPGTRYSDFLAAIGLIAAAATFWILDYTRLLCDPANHLFQGHAAWHVLAALSFAFTLAFYRQFPEPARNKSATL